MSGSMEYRQEQIPASGEIALTGANFFFLVNASAAVTVRFMGGGTDFGANSILAGVQIGRVVPWTRAVIRGGAGTTVAFFYGDAELREDVTDFRSTIATISGTTVTAESPAAAFVTPDKATIAAGASADFAANLARRRVTVGNESDSPNSFWLRSQAGVTDAGLEVQPGAFVEVRTTAAFRLRNNGAGPCDYTVLEES